jgi:hypothetical protein
MNRSDEILDAFRQEMEELMEMAKNLDDGSTINIPVEKCLAICDLSAKVLDEAAEHAEQNRAMKATIEVGDRMISRLSGIDVTEPIL